MAMRLISGQYMPGFYICPLKPSGRQRASVSSALQNQPPSNSNDSDRHCFVVFLFFIELLLWGLWMQ